ncbi:hypothetical protein [Ketobacter alkanivorans]|uniref:Uncharacterized protein n=1 Tax=Ketobacter alkanivorans TaxID=1917421 RepID=A0A2K9LML8_9GAMM|nr:hypothetical protein [Ketobacter alkanivorans]AUM13477.1 hypothetical protein Kalk_14055 [Ketobacter alkanivorans]
MRISIRNNSSYIIEFDQLIVSGREAAGGYAFSFTLRGSRPACSAPVSIFDISLSLSLSDPVRPLLTAVPSSTQVVQCHSFGNNSEQIHFECVLTKGQVNAIEDYRLEGDLKLNVGLRALTTSSDGLLTSFDVADVVVPREHWLNALKSAGFRQTLLFEVPLPAVSEELSGLMGKAQEFIETGHYKDAVMQCRHIIEQIEKVRDDKRQSSAANAKAHSKERQDMSSIERLLSLREQLKNVCQLGAHGSEYFTRSQAKAVLAIMIALLAEPTVGFVYGEEYANE